jgi:hypothetical protein
MANYGLRRNKMAKITNNNPVSRMFPSIAGGTIGYVLGAIIVAIARCLFRKKPKQKTKVIVREVVKERIVFCDVREETNRQMRGDIKWQR